MKRVADRHYFRTSFGEWRLLFRLWHIYFQHVDNIGYCWVFRTEHCLRACGCRCRNRQGHAPHYHSHFAKKQNTNSCFCPYICFPAYCNHFDRLLHTYIIVVVYADRVSLAENHRFGILYAHFRQKRKRTYLSQKMDGKHAILE